MPVPDISTWVGQSTAWVRTRLAAPAGRGESGVGLTVDDWFAPPPAPIPPIRPLPWCWQSLGWAVGVPVPVISNWAARIPDPQAPRKAAPHLLEREARFLQPWIETAESKWLDRFPQAPEPQQPKRARPASVDYSVLLAAWLPAPALEGWAAQTPQPQAARKLPASAYQTNTPLYPAWWATVPTVTVDQWVPQVTMPIYPRRGMPPPEALQGPLVASFSVGAVTGLGSLELLIGATGAFTGISAGGVGSIDVVVQGGGSLDV